MKKAMIGAALSCALLPACVQPEDDAPLAEDEQAINNGTPITAEGSGDVLLSTSVGGCSGTLVTNDFVLTARHCFAQADVNTPSLVSLSMGSQHAKGASVALDPNSDTAVVKLAAPFMMNGSTRHHQALLYPLPINQLHSGEFVHCEGYGDNNFANSTGFGTLRSADLPVRGTNFFWWTLHFDLGLNPNAQNQFLAEGDSGSSCTKVMPSGERVIVGVTSSIYAGLDATINNLVSTDTFRPFYTNTVTPSADAAVQWGTAGDIPLAEDWDHDGYTDYVVWRPSNGYWYIKNALTNWTYSYQWGQSGDVPVRGDFNGDGLPDLVVWRPLTGVWWVKPSGGTAFTQQWGKQGDIPAAADYDGDGRTDFAVFRPSTGEFFIIDSRTGFAHSLMFGTSGDVPVPGDYDGDGRADVAVWRPSTGTWFVRNSATGVITTQQWGQFGDTPLTGYLGCHAPGATGATVWRPWSGAWFIPGHAAPLFGQPGDVPQMGSFGGLNSPDFAIWRPSTGTWFVQINPYGC